MFGFCLNSSIHSVLPTNNFPFLVKKGNHLRLNKQTQANNDI